MFYIYVLYYKKFEKELFYENFIIYENGPGLKSIYETYIIFDHYILPIINFRTEESKNVEKHFILEALYELEKYSTETLVKKSLSFLKNINVGTNKIISKKK